MTIDYNKLTVHIDLEALRHNVRVLSRNERNTAPVVKCDAYGHGLVEVVNALAKDGAHTFCVGTVDEAVKLRQSGFAGRVIALLGPLDEHEYPALQQHNIIPFMSSIEAMERLVEHTEGLVNICLKFDTGMARLGMDPDDVGELVDWLAKHEHVRPVMAASHFAVADEPDDGGYTDYQVDRFCKAIDGLKTAGYNVEVTQANSAGCMAHAKARWDMQRLGIAMYGANPFHGTRLAHLGEELRPAMSVTAPVLQIHPLKKGQTVSYGRTFTADRDMTIAVVAVGYADCYSRGLSGKEAAMNFRGHRLPILGRVCMQMTCVDVTPLAEQGVDISIGDRIYLLGGPEPGVITPEDLAGWWGTITYEVFCVLGMNRREYQGS